MKNFNALNDKEKEEVLDSIKSVFTDCDGVLWLGNNTIPNAVDAINQLKKINKNIFFITNNSTKTRKELLEKSVKVGFQVELEEMVTSSYLTALYLKSQNFKKKAYIIGMKSISEELASVGIDSFGYGPDPYLAGSSPEDIFKKDPEVSAVIVGHDVNFSYPKVVKACNYLADPDCLFIATNTDPSLPTHGQILTPGAGSFVTSVETCSGRNPTIIGKPSTVAFAELIKEGNLSVENSIMIGDRCDTDIAFGNSWGMKTLLVLTGVETLATVEKYIKENKSHLIPTYYANSIGDLVGRKK